MKKMTYIIVFNKHSTLLLSCDVNVCCFHEIVIFYLILSQRVYILSKILNLTTLHPKCNTIYCTLLKVIVILYEIMQYGHNYRIFCLLMSYQHIFRNFKNNKKQNLLDLKKTNLIKKFSTYVKIIFEGTVGSWIEWTVNCL